MQIGAVVFDIGNVLIAWNPERFYDDAVGKARRRAFFAAVPFFALMDRIDAGAPFAAEIERTAREYPAFATEILMLRDCWCDIAQPDIPHSVRLLAALAARGIPRFALSNFGAQNFPLSVAAHPFLGTFDRHYVSGEMGMAKPDPAIYAAVEKDCGIAPERLLFTDDRADNIAVAAARGWQTHLFDSPAGFAQCLVNAGLLTQEEAK